MAIWSGIGMNYGHQFTDVNYSTTQVESDFTALRVQGVNKIRIIFPGYQNSTGITNAQDMITRALAHGFYVIWGVDPGVGSGGLTSTIWSSFKTYVTGTLATWAQSNALSELAVGNECDARVDGSTLTAATVRSDVLSMATTIRTGGYTGKISYDTAAGSSEITGWASSGVASLDYIGWNSYDTLTNFQSNMPTFVSDFGAKAYISEFGGIDNGYPDFNNEILFHHDTIDRLVAMQKNNIPSGYFFTYRDGSDNIAPNTFGIIQPNGVPHLALNAILGIALPFYGNFIGHA